MQALYQAAGLNLSADLQNLTKHANIRPDPAAVSSLEQTSVPTGHLSVPELDLHTIGDNLVPVTMENFYAKQVTEAGDRSLLYLVKTVASSDDTATRPTGAAWPSPCHQPATSSSTATGTRSTHWNLACSTAPPSPR